MAQWDESQRSRYMDAEARHRYTREDSVYAEWCEVVLDMPYEFWLYCKGQEGGNAQAFLLRLIEEHRTRGARHAPPES